MSEFTVVVCTRNRPAKLRRTLDALDRQSFDDFGVVVVDQSAVPDPGLAPRTAKAPELEVVNDPGTGLSRARNIGCERASSPWVAFVDDDCLPTPDWALELSTAIRSHPEASLISGNVEGDPPTTPGQIRASVSEVREERTLRGPRTPPFRLGLGVCIVVRRDVIRGLGGFDVRLGPGAPDFPAADDMDFNYRFLRAGGVAYVTPRMRAVHEQWRSSAALIRLYRGYWRSAAAMAMKHVKTNDIRGGLWLWGLAGRDVAGMAWGALKRRSMLRLRVAGVMLVGLIEGTLLGATRDW